MILYILILVTTGIVAHRQWNKDRPTSYLLIAFMAIWIIGMLFFGTPPANMVD